MNKYKLFSFAGDLSVGLALLAIEVEAEKEREDAEVVCFLEDLRDT